MGVPAFYRWLSEKYPKCIQDVLEERVPETGTVGYDWSRPNPNGELFPADAECDNLYIDMNGIIHPCAHPEQGPQPATEEQMYVNVAAAVDRLLRVIRPRQLLFLAIDGVAPRAKMNQQRARRFRAAQEARELKELEDSIRVEIKNENDSEDGNEMNNGDKKTEKGGAWDSNVITPGTPFMLGLAQYMRFYIRQRLSTDKAWRNLRVLFSDASIPGEGEHKIMSHVRLQRAQPGYNAGLVHVLHGLDADLIMLALATHEAHFYISREEVLFGRKSIEQQEQRQLETGFTDAQRRLDEAVGSRALSMPVNCQKPLQRVSIPILREYLAAEFDVVLQNPQFHHAQGGNHAPASLERLIDDFVFLCFFVGNDFLPHLPSLDIRDGALDFLLNVYKGLVPTTGYLTAPGGNLQLPAISQILQQVGAIEDYVFGLKHENEQRRQAEKERFRKNNNRGKPPPPPPDGSITVNPQFKGRGRAARILNAGGGPQALKASGAVKTGIGTSKPMLQVKTMESVENKKAAQALKDSLLGKTSRDAEAEKESTTMETGEDTKEEMKKEEEEAGTNGGNDKKDSKTNGKRKASNVVDNDGVGQVGDLETEFDADEEDDDADDDDDDEDGPPEIPVPPRLTDEEAAKAFKEKVKVRQQLKLDEYAKNVVDNVRLHEPGWKDRYYSDKCKAEDVEEHGGKEHLFRTYVMGLVWVMKYYYDGCPSWKFYFPFHYAPFASDLQNIERFAKDIKSFQLGKPFNPVEQLMAVLPSDSSHAIPSAARWLMSDPESPIIDFYPKDVPVDPNGKAMPWLWVVLLPFIEEDRLLSALGGTMQKWTKQELLCNVRGLDDAYLYVHSTHPLKAKLATVLNGRTPKDPKIKLNDGAAYGCGGFSGSLRPPLSDEIYPIEEDDIKIKAPPGSDQIDDPLPDNLFLEDIDPNMAICVSFSEPLKLPHKSILLPGAKPPAPVLTEDDKRIRRPRINRGGSIANMGMSNGKSYQSGYGSMNISSYERELAEKTGRGRQMYQAGTRSWGSMEPTPKRPRVNANPFQGQQHHQGPPQQAWGAGPPGHGYPPHQQPPPHGYPGNQGRPPQYSQRPPHYQQPHYNNNQGRPQQQQQPYHQQQGRYQQPPPRPPYQQPPPYANQHNQGRPQRPPPPHQQQQYQQRGPPQRPPYQQPPRGGPPPQQQQGFSFRQGGAPPAAPQRSRTSADTMKSLRDQLSSTLQQNKRG